MVPDVYFRIRIRMIPRRLFPFRIRMTLRRLFPYPYDFRTLISVSVPESIRIRKTVFL